MPKITRTKARSMTKVETKQSKKSIRSDNLHISLTPSIFRKVRGSSSRSTARSRSRTGATKSVTAAPINWQAPKPAGPFTVVPENAAVHFTNFYNSQENSVPAEYREEILRKSEDSTRNAPKTEFTRQMVYKLEHSSGTEYYGRQVSALLEETVEPPGFNVRLPPADNCAPLNKASPYYPLWYKDPYEMPQIATQQYRSIKEKYGKVALSRLLLEKRSEDPTASAEEVVTEVADRSDAKTGDESDGESGWEAETEDESVEESIVERITSVASTTSGRSAETEESVKSCRTDESAKSATSNKSSDSDSESDLKSEEEGETEDDEEVEGSIAWQSNAEEDDDMSATVTVQ